jgi:starch synthase
MYVDPKTEKDYSDNDIRFAFFARSVLSTLEKLEFKPDIIHVNDWQSALIPAYLKTAERDHPFFKDTKTVLTIHNVAYQGLFPQESFDKLGINKNFLYPKSPFEFWGKLNYLKAGVVYSDVVNTVSETYAQEIQSSNEFGFGLEGVLRDKRNSLFGVVNGVDYDTWSPENDKLIKQPYDIKNVEEKIENKKELLRYCGLSEKRADQPLIGIIGRLTDQKGFDLIEEIADDLFKRDITLVQLGTGDEKYKKLFEKLEKKFPDRFKAHFTFDERLAHLIEAGADIFLMPSRFEPCGLNQLYSLKYGTIPVAHKTGGLADTIINYDGNGNKRQATGFLFDEYSGKAFLKAIEGALDLYNKTRSWRAMMKRGMKKDFSWKQSAKKYLELYERALGVKAI